MSNTTNCLWLGTLLTKEDYQEASNVLNEILQIKSCKIYNHKIIDELSIVYFTIDNSDIPEAALTRLMTNDIKWESDYPKYSIDQEVNSESI